MTMAANPKTLRIVAASTHHASTRVLQVECVEGAPFAAVGGKYVIVHLGAGPGDRPIKRAYSLMPVHDMPERAQLAIKRLHGPGSDALHTAAVGATLGFSGPWGKLIPEQGLHERSLLVATDTGISSALGIVMQAAADDTTRPLEVLWLRSAQEDFLDVDTVTGRIEKAGVRCRLATIPEVSAHERTSMAWALIDARVVELGPGLVIATGDGAIVHPLRARLPQHFAHVRDVRIECFFRNPEKKSG